MVTINKTRTHWLHVVNEARENKPSIAVRPTGGQATYDSAQIFSAVIRHIEVKSKAQTAYKMACGHQVGGGIGYWRIVTEYADDNGFDQEILIKQVPDPLAVYLDPHIKNQDGSDARFGFIYEDMPRDKFEDKYPSIKVIASQDTGVQSWVMRDTVRVAHYYEVETRKEWLYATTGDDGMVTYKRESDMEPNERQLYASLVKQGAENVLRRRVDKRTVKSYIIAGNRIAEKGIWPGKYIPIIRVPGEEIVLEGKLDRKGLTRYLKDAQRSYNYNASANLEYGALQTKAPWVGPLEAFEGLENYWSTANTTNHAFLPYNDKDETGNPIAPPQRPEPPTAAPVYLAGMQAAEREMMMASGQYEATFSEQGNEVSGVALDGRKKQGDRVTFHFLDALADAIRFTGVQLIDLIPKIYDTKRMIRIIGDDGQEQAIQIDPSMQVPLQQKEQAQDNKVAAIFNPGVGEYEVVAEVGPSYASRRQEAFQAMKELIAAVPELAQVIGDLFMGTADFPVADKLQERMRNWIPKQILGEGPTPQEQQLMQQLEQLGQVAQQLQQAVLEKDQALQIEKQRTNLEALNHLAVRMENERNDLISAFKAETDRLKALLGAMDPEELKAIVTKLVSEVVTAPNPAEDITPPEMDPTEAYALGLPSVTAPTVQPVPVPEPVPQQPIPQ